MAKVNFRQEAINDLTDIWEYTLHEWSENQAERYYNSIKFACKEIGDKSSIGKIYTEINTNLFGLSCGKHIIFYQQTSEEEIEVIRILHERMDLKNKIFI
ncbi:type II toxin-antitoxin system RelE/ParE family toxin [Chryseobacterium sp. MP_3.2]|uniref:type II toxin-antitoxin system RelE/ParE family toxin n=1 Tax=Chryseobacterium sp. MP_3.2 TaxID=3071712 RepID=UPI002DFAEB5B|nr:toxin ParE1/3/4 [Chryseobacterium sp. MP_3.2]